jgi:hypothetical protein
MESRASPPGHDAVSIAETGEDAVPPSHDSRHRCASVRQRFNLAFESLKLGSAPIELFIITLDPAIGE